MKILILLGTLLGLLSAWSLWDGFRFLSYVRRSWRTASGDFTPPATVIIPCKGWAPDFEQNLSGYLSQDYPRYELILVVASEDDPAYAALAARRDSFSSQDRGHPAKVTVVVAGYAEARGEKVNNLVRGRAAADPSSEVLAFADMDARPRGDWLRSLVSPLADLGITVSTGFRWYLPGPGLASRLRAAWDTAIATLLGDHNRNFAWGGSMAIRVAEFNRLQIAERYWANTVSDDYAVTRAIREARGSIHFEPRCLVASREDCSFRGFLRWANRQIIITRVYAPRLWGQGLASNGLHCGTLLTGAVLAASPTVSMTGRVVIAALLAFVILAGTAKGYLRTAVAREIFPEERELLARYGACYWQLAPLVPWIMLGNFIVAGFARRIEWQGAHYELISPDAVRIVRRDAP